MAGFVELIVEQGATFTTVVNLSDSTGAVLNLSGYSAASQIRKSYYSSTATDILISVSDASNGEITMSITSANTANLTPGKYVFDMVATDSYNVKTRVIEGIVNVLASVTR